MITGATGFVGRSLLDEIGVAIEQGLDVETCIALSRDPKNAQALLDPLQSRYWLSYEEYFVNKGVPDIGRSDVFFHLAVPASADLNSFHPDEMYSLNVTGILEVIDSVSRQEVPPALLLSSSGAVYGEMPHDLTQIPEGWERPQSTIPLSSAYAEGKIVAEEMLREATRKGKCLGLIARLFAFSGVHLPLDRHFAIGNFVRDAVMTQRITIRGTGSPIRSYMDGKDMAQWLLRIVESGSPDHTYHVGSERAISIRDLAALVAHRYEMLSHTSVNIEVLDKTSLIDGVSRYVPSTQFTRTHLKVEETVSLEHSIDQMIRSAMKSLRSTTSD